MITVGLFPVGYNKINIPRICKFLNNTQSVYLFKEATDILNLGTPDLGDYSYSDNAFELIINPHYKEYDFSVIITCAPLEKNYYTRTILNKIIIITFYESEEVIKESNRTEDEYLIIAISQELICFEFERVTNKSWQELFHKDTRGCIFDFVGIKSQKVAKLNTCQICESCRGKLYSSHLNNQIIKAFEKVLLKIKRPSFIKSIMQCILSPIVSFVYGGIVIGTVINLLSSFIMADNEVSYFQKTSLMILSSLIVVFPLFIYTVDWIKYFHNRLK